MTSPMQVGVYIIDIQSIDLADSNYQWIFPYGLTLTRRKSMPHR